MELPDLKAAAPRIKRILFNVMIAALALAACLFAFKLFRASPPVNSVMVAAHEAAPVAGLIKQPLPQPVIVKAYPKAQAVKRLNLSGEIAINPVKEVISSAAVKPSQGGYDSITVLDTQTGEATTMLQEKPRSLFSVGGSTEIGARYGLTMQGGQQGAVYARQDVLRIGAVHLAGYGELNAGMLARPEAKAMIDVSYRW